MNEIKALSNPEVLRKTRELATEERRINAALLRYLHEVEVRRLHLDLGFPSLYAFCIKHLKLSEGATSRRISAMRLIHGLPNRDETLQALEQGQVNLNTLSAVHHFLREEKKPYTPEQKQELVQEIQGRSQRECEVLFASISPQVVPKERERVLTETQTELRVILNEELRLQLEKIKALVSHRNPSPTYAELFALMAEIVLKKLDPEQQKGCHKPQRANVATAQAQHAVTRTRWIPSPIRRAVWKRDGGACTYVDLESGQRCGSRFQIQLDHRIPFAQGGESSLENLRCVCRKHNFLYAVQAFGADKMEAFSTAPKN